MAQQINRKSITIGIPAYNESHTIGPLLRSILRQKGDNFLIKEIIVVSDNSTDATGEEVKKIDDKRILLIEGKERLGNTERIRQILKLAQGDIIVLLDADITINSTHVLEHLVSPFYQYTHVGLVGGNRKCFPARTFVEKSIQTSIIAYDNIAQKFNKGNNPYNCHGCALALSKEFAKKIIIPKQIFSSDTFLYFACLAGGYKFYHAPQAEVFVRTANNFKDAVTQYRRFLAMDTYTKNEFSDLVETEYDLPFKLRYTELLKVFLSQPLHTLTMLVIKTHSKYRGVAHGTSPVWTIAKSTKGITS